MGLSARAFAEIYGQHLPELTRYCQAIARNRDDAEDAAQNAMERALRALARGEQPQRIRPWLFTIAHHEAISLLRRRKATAQLDDAEPAPGASTEELCAVRERLAELLGDLRELAPRQRDVLVARELGGRSYRDIARDFATSEAAAQQMVLEARRSLRHFEDGRSLECGDVQSWLSVHDHARIRTRRVRAHLRSCNACAGFETGIRSRRRDLALLLPGVGSGPLWSSLAALLAPSAAKLAATCAIVTAGVTLVSALPEGGRRDPARPGPVAAAGADAPVPPASPPRLTRTQAARPADRAPAARRAPERRRAGAVRRRPASAGAPARNVSTPAAPVAPAAASRPDREPAPGATPAPSPTPGPQATAGPTGPPAVAPEPVGQLVRQTTEPVIDVVEDTVETVTGTVDQVRAALPDLPLLHPGR